MTSTQIQVNTRTSGLSKRSATSSSLPSYRENSEYFELANLTPSTTVSEASSPPGYQDTVAQPSSSSSSNAFPLLYATHSFQIEAPGHAMIALPLPPRPIPISISPVSSDGNVGTPAYESIRPSRRSGSCMLVRAGDSQETPVCTTTYRFGPGRAPKIQLFQSAASDEEFEITSKSFATRTQVIRTHLGTFEWRYAGRKERHQLSADSLLVLDQVTTVALANGKKEESRRRVAQLVRNAEFRSHGTGRCTSGNGGRLVLDLRKWAGGKGEAEQMELLVISSCLAMLKKEVDRRRMIQAAAISGGGGGAS